MTIKGAVYLLLIQNERDFAEVHCYISSNDAVREAKAVAKQLRVKRSKAYEDGYLYMAFNDKYTVSVEVKEVL